VSHKIVAPGLDNWLLALAGDPPTCLPFHKSFPPPPLRPPYSSTVGYCYVEPSLLPQLLLSAAIPSWPVFPSLGHARSRILAQSYLILTRALPLSAYHGPESVPIFGLDGRLHRRQLRLSGASCTRRARSVGQQLPGLFLVSPRLRRSCV
jgi:hypothetical protein